MGVSRLAPSVISSSVHPIGVGEFVNALSNVLNTTKIHHRPRIGLAISGGVDSMALGSLCSQIQHSPQNLTLAEAGGNLLNLLQNNAFHAFVVDHGVRQGSDVEADFVSRVLEKRGIQTQVLKIQWHEHHEPAEMPNFESRARKYRFQVLGRACRELGINSLLLAHHQDDQAETVMMRMIRGHRMLGLIGIKGDSEIPECYGIHGVHESGGIGDTTDWVRQREHYSGVAHSLTALPDFAPDGSNPSSQLPIENGGVRVYRPLLGFSKARLRATCESTKMEWFEDHTNKDPTLTIRNAIRHMYSSHSMPAALTKPALLALSRKFKDKAASQLSTITSWLNNCNITQFETRSGLLKIRFNDLNIVRQSSTIDEDKRQIAASLLRRVIMLVTPEEHVHISSLHGAVQHIYPELFLDTNQNIPPPSKFTVAGVQFCPLFSLSNRTGSALSSQGHRGIKKCEWRISRQPYTSTPSKIPLLTIPAIGSPPTAVWPSWALFDGRFWIRIQSTYNSPIFVRPFRKGDLRDFMSRLSTADAYRLRDYLKRLAPGDIRWTLPAIVLEVVPGNKKVLALPTLDIAVLESLGELKWEVRYKKIDLSGLPLADRII